MVKKRRRRHLAAYKFRVLLETLESSKTIRQRPDYRTPAEEHFVFCSEPAAFA